MAINNATIMGRITAPLEIKQAGEHKVLTFSVAVDRPYTDDEGEREADFIRCIAWNGTAEFICRYFDKGRMIAVTGRLQSSSYEDSNGSMHYPTDLVVQQVSFTGEAKPKEQQDQAPKKAGNKSGKKKQTYSQGYPF